MVSYLTNYFENVNNIIEKSKFNGSLFLGNYKAALDPVFLKQNDISVIINCSQDLPYIYDLVDPSEYGLFKLETFRIPVNDSLMEQDFYIMEKYLHKVLPFLLKKLLTEKKNILIHCHMGRQRSSGCVAALLYVLVDNNLLKFELNKKGQIGGSKEYKSELMKRVIEYIKVKRPQVFTYGWRVNFKPSLERFFNIKI